MATVAFHLEFKSYPRTRLYVRKMKRIGDAKEEALQICQMACPAGDANVPDALQMMK